jgi:hypothetical protein
MSLVTKKISIAKSRPRSSIFARSTKPKAPREETTAPAERRRRASSRRRFDQSSILAMSRKIRLRREHDRATAARAAIAIERRGRARGSIVRARARACRGAPGARAARDNSMEAPVNGLVCRGFHLIQTKTKLPS